MACKYSPNFPTPQDFPTIYHDFLQSLLKDKPSDPIDYGAFYFESKNAVIIYYKMKLSFKKKF